jgi:hypothetical protein
MFEAGRRTPPGWPTAVRPPDAPDWERTAVQWLLDLCPADYRGYPVLQRHPLALAWFARHHLEGARAASIRALSMARVDLTEDLPVPAMAEVVQAVEVEQARLLASVRGVVLVEEALRGRRYIPRL